MPIANYFQFNVFTLPNPNNLNNPLVNVQVGPHGLYSGGLVMDIEIRIDEITAKTLPSISSNSINVKALFDTGCTITSIDLQLANKLNLKTIGYSTTSTANGNINVSQHLVSLKFPGTNLTGKPVHTVQTVNLSEQPFQILIGRDLMTTWKITYNGPAGFVSIAD